MKITNFTIHENAFVVFVLCVGVWNASFEFSLFKIDFAPFVILLITALLSFLIMWGGLYLSLDRAAKKRREESIAQLDSPAKRHIIFGGVKAPLKYRIRARLDRVRITPTYITLSSV